MASSEDGSADTDDEWERTIPQTAETKVYLHSFRVLIHLISNIPLHGSTLYVCAFWGPFSSVPLQTIISPVSVLFKNLKNLKRTQSFILRRLSDVSVNN